MEVQNQNILGETERSKANPEREAYKLALLKVKKLKRFYVHLIVYILVNAFIIFSKFRHLHEDQTFFTFETFSTAFFWGIGLVAHAFSVFVPHFLFGSDWENKKVKQFMKKDKNSNWE